MNRILLSLALGTTFLAVPLTAHALGLHAVEGSSVTLNGDSTLHKFDAHSTEVAVAATLDPSVSAAEALSAVLTRQAMKDFSFSVPVTSLRSHDKGLDKNMYKAMKATQCPTITFNLASYRVTPNADGTSAVEAPGTLTISCTTKPVTLQGTLASEGERLRLRGSYTLLMSEYGITPPSMMMGAIKTRDKIVIDYALTLKPE